MKITAHSLRGDAQTIRPATVQRDWMDAHDERHPYRCLPLTIANCHGWELLCPGPVTVTWNGGTHTKDLTITTAIDNFALSSFGYGIVTFNVDYVFATDPQWNLLATGPFNRPKDNATPLTGVIETHWLPYPFTMNWQLAQPGTVTFDKDEPFCLIFPVSVAVADFDIEVSNLKADDDLTAKFIAFRDARVAAIAKMYAGDPVLGGWQKHYFNGRYPDGTPAPTPHMNKLRLKPVSVLP